MSFFNWNEEQHKRRFDEKEESPEPEPKSPRLDVPESEKGRWEYGEYTGETLTYLKVSKLPNITKDEPVEAVFPPGRQVVGDLLVTVDGYRWLRLTKPYEFFGKYLVTEDWDKRHTYIQIDNSLSIPQNLYRIKQDNPARMLDPDWQFESMRWSAPTVHTMYPTKNSAYGSVRTRLSPWESFLRSLNDTKNKWTYYTNDHSGLFDATGWDKQETLVMWNNLVVVDEILSGGAGIQMAKLRTLFIEDPQPDASLLNYQTCPWYIHKFTVVTRKGFVVDPNPGAVFYPLITNTGEECWIEMDKLEKFPTLPMKVKVEEKSGINVREEPRITGNKVTAIAKGATLEIAEYRPTGSEVWARCDKGWMALYYPHTTPQYLTSWRMEAAPPPA